MSRALVASVEIHPPKELACLFDHPPLVGNETYEQYETFLFAVARAVLPTDTIAWIFTKDVTDLAWDTRRERNVKTEIIKFSEIEVVSELLDICHNPMVGLSEAALRWSTDQDARDKIGEQLSKRGYSMTRITAMAFERAADQIDAVDRRIASYELRRMLIIKEVSLYNEKLARRLDRTSLDVLDGEFSEAAE